MTRNASETLRALVFARTLRSLTRAVVLSMPVVLVVSVVATTAQAQTDESREEAKRLFAQGSSAFLAKRYADALEDLRASYKLVPSPNSGLLIARSLRELNRRVEAVEMYATVTAEARRRASDGDAKYAQTADVAAAEGTAVRATLGTVRVRVAHPPPGTRVEIDGVSMPAGEIVVLHPPGEVTVKLMPKTGAEQSQRATLTAGGEVRMEFAPAPIESAPPGPLDVGPAPPAVAPSAHGEAPAWTVPAAITSGGVALVGAGVFVGFGLESKRIYDDLRARCGAAGCGPAERPQADHGKRDQTIANVGLVVGIVALAATGAFLLVRAYAPRTASTTVLETVMAISGAPLRATF